VSPGGWPSGIGPKNVLDEQNPRNRRLAEALGRSGLVERAGQGANLMFERAVRLGKPLPAFKDSSPNTVWLTLDGVLKNPTLVRFLELVGQETQRGFSTLDFLAIDSISREVPLSPALRVAVPALRAAGVIESVGRGRGTQHILSQRLASALGEAGTYTRRRGLDRETNKALLLRHIRERVPAGAPVGELRQVLPSASPKTLRTLLEELRREGNIVVTGERRWAVYLSAAMAHSEPKNGA